MKENYFYYHLILHFTHFFNPKKIEANHVQTHQKKKKEEEKTHINMMMIFKKQNKTTPQSSAF